MKRIHDFDDQRKRTDCKCWRISPDIPGLSFVKSAIVFAYCWHLISCANAQRLIDLSQSWEA